MFKKDFFANFKLHERMLLIFILSSILPMILMLVYLFGNVRQLILNQAQENETERLEILAESISHRMDIVSDLAHALEEDDQIIEISKREYTSEDDFEKDVDNCYFLKNYIKYYPKEISHIEVYVWNDTIFENDYFTKITSDLWSEKWYMNIINSKVDEYWAYQFGEDGQVSLTLSRIINDSEGNPVAIVRLILPSDATGMEILNSDENTLLYYDDIMPLQSNFTGDFDAINILLQHDKSEMNSSVVKYNGEKYIMSFLRIYPAGSEHRYTILSMKPYSDIETAVTKTAVKIILPTLLLIFLGIHLILLFAASYSKRLNIFKDSMHKAANGNLDPVKVIEGKDEIAELNTDLQAMIDGITKLMQSLVLENVQREQLHTRQREVEFKMLANQINPHFLYNTLETIRMTARVNNQPDIEELTKMLAKILRRNIQAGENLQTVSSEMQLIEYYLKIQDYRFHDRITYQVEIENPERVGPMKIMPLLIQPFVENAFGHGLEGKEADGKITITAKADSWLWIIVSDNGNGMSKEQLQEIRDAMEHLEELDRTHIGICNVQQRIKYRYGEEYGVSIESEQNKGTTVTIKLPVNGDYFQ